MSNQGSFPGNNATRAAEHSPLLDTNKIKLELNLHKETKAGCSANNYRFIHIDRVNNIHENMVSRRKFYGNTHNFI